MAAVWAAFEWGLDLKRWDTDRITACTKTRAHAVVLFLWVLISIMELIVLLFEFISCWILIAVGVHGYLVSMESPGK
jgi:hypothetical protein